ncbi:proline racemase family protein [Solicola gregarius]|uniref:Proline racemase family protein n=1 Tax=Solicola gregarius TaxID=2908642 RepID=A0AA46YKP3_9ACTN|nr:proline racemase family protein [Solicola gregarius]UYM05712.1 proline racemase family protein [Solicola gregarius]
MQVRTVDYHTAGEPFRIVVEAPALEGSTVADKRVHAQTGHEAERVRELLVREPRGHADMYGGFVVEPDDAGADLGVVFWHQDGYSTACGHGTIALATWAVESGLVQGATDGDIEVTVDVPSGRVVGTVHRTAGRTGSVTFRNVESYVIARGVRLETSRGPVDVDVSYGGAIYASVAAGPAGLAVDPDRYSELIALGREVKALLAHSPHARHPTDDRLSGIYGTIVYDDLGRTQQGPHQRNVTIFADGEVDRSPCGSGTGARVALLADDGTLGAGETLTHDSIVDTRFTARALPGTRADTVVPEVTGAAYRTGEHLFVLDADDPLQTGFVLR